VFNETRKRTRRISCPPQVVDASLPQQPDPHLALVESGSPASLLKPAPREVSLLTLGNQGEGSPGQPGNAPSNRDASESGPTWPSRLGHGSNPGRASTSNQRSASISPRRIPDPTPRRSCGPQVFWRRCSSNRSSSSADTRDPDGCLPSPWDQFRLPRRMGDGPRYSRPTAQIEHVPQQRDVAVDVAGRLDASDFWCRVSRPALFQFRYEVLDIA